MAHIIAEFSQNPRDVATVPTDRREPKWFYVSVFDGSVFVESGKHHTSRPLISSLRKLDPTEYPRMLELYRRRKSGEPVAQEAVKTTHNQVYWYGIFAELKM